MLGFVECIQGSLVKLVGAVGGSRIVFRRGTFFSDSLAQIHDAGSTFWASSNT